MMNTASKTCQLPISANVHTSVMLGRISGIVM